ncbi:FAS1 domain-containing protein [Hygrophoropsis aurantiaca]|uniref:FAS1 domain-containing protein n=1 Tax=Hygrophoropsis aurantiaca TaxID=72124 RepID=A0ACB7ZQA2_9AGAM|nr:FAS1 domain-containing protein [Hygrophoropsis aurantiaca]
MNFFKLINLLLFVLTASAFSTSSILIDALVEALGGFTPFGIFISLLEAIPPEDIAEFASLITNNITFGVPQSAPNGTVSNLLGNPSTILPLLSYHLIKSPVSNSSIPLSPTHIIVSTALIASLENNRSQVLVLTKDSNGTIHVLNQPSDVTLTPSSGITFAGNSYGWSSVSDLLVAPTTLSATLPSYNITTFANDAVTSGITDTLENLQGLTIFVPQDSAFSSAASTLSHLNSSELASVLSGHVINGTLYSPQLTSGQTTMNFAGQTLTVTGSNVSLTGGNTANILTSDVLLQNGVVHIIDNVLMLDSLKSSAAISMSVGPWVTRVTVLALGSYLVLAQ